MNRIVTLTLNPAFDTHCRLDKLELHRENFATLTSTEAGGKGVNVSRALWANGVENRAVILTGEDNRELFLKKLADDGLCFSPVPTPGRIRENLTVHESGREETRISFPGFCCDRAVLNAVSACVGEVDARTTVTFTGSAPVGISTKDLVELLLPWQRRGAKIVIDSRSFAPDDLVAFRPWLIKPNKQEAAAFAGAPVTDPLSAAQVARHFHQKGIENVMISLGPDGAVLACPQGVFHATTPNLPIVSTIGAGDSTVAGFVAAAQKGLSAPDTLAQAMAWGTAACLQQGTRPPQPKDIQAILPQITVSEM